MGFSPRELGKPATALRPHVVWEETRCLLCGGGNWSPLVEAPDTTEGGCGLWFVVVQCQDCGLCFTNPRPSESCMGAFYPPEYGPHQVPDLRHRRQTPRHAATSWRLPRS